MALRTNTVMVSNQDTDEFVYPSNSDDSDFEEILEQFEMTLQKSLILHLHLHLV